ncbi:MAG: NlpC/P60 family protein [Solirubrobacterales bacterium]
MNRKTLAATFALIFTLSINATALAAPTSTKSAAQQGQELLSKIETLDSQISDVTKKIDDNKKSIDKSNKEMASMQKQITKAETDIQVQQDLFDKRVRAMYISGVDAYISVLLESDGISDFIARVDSVRQIMDYDQDVISELNDKRDAIAKKKEQLKAENDKVVALKAENQKKLDALNKDKDDAEKLAASMNLYAYADDNNSAVIGARNNVNNIWKNASSYDASRGAAAVSSNSIVAYAYNFMGRPYQWGGNGPNSFDCSGFTTYVYAHFGISLPRTSQEQQWTGSAVSYNNLQPGDLVFFGSPAHHVGIYVGDGCYIHAPRTGDVIKISPLNRTDYSGARRVR